VKDSGLDNLAYESDEETAIDLPPSYSICSDTGIRIPSRVLPTSRRLRE